MAGENPDPQDGSGGPFAPPSQIEAVVDDHGVVTGWSDGATHLLGYRADQVIGRDAVELLAEGTLDIPWSPTHSVRRHGSVRLRHRDGHEVQARWVAHRRPAASAPGPSGRSDQPGHTGQPSYEWLIWSATDAVDTDDDALLHAAFVEGPCAAAIYGPDLRLRRANAKMEEAFGLTEAAMCGLRASEIAVHPHLAETDAAIREVFETGRQLHRENFFRTPGRARHQAWAVSLAPLTGDDGRVRAVCLTAHDETQKYWARQRLQLLNDAGARIGSSLEVEATARELAGVALGGLADLVTVDLLPDTEAGTASDVGDGFGTGGPVRLRRVAHAAHPDGTGEGSRGDGPAAGAAHDSAPASEGTHTPERATGGVRTYAADSPQARCLAAGHSVASAPIGPRNGDAATPHTPTQAPVPHGGMQWLAVPLHARGTTLGAALFGRHNPEEPFDHDDLLLAEEMTARAALCIDNALRYTRERAKALALQRSLLPRRLPRLAAVEAASRYLPTAVQAGVGGDWFDVIPLSSARVALVVGDVVGHGIQASTTMGRLRTAVRTLADVDLAPDELLTHLDELVTRLAEEPDAEKPDAGLDSADDTAGLGATCVYAVYDPISRKCTMARAGHPPPVLVGRDGTAHVLDVPAGPPLGVGGLPFESMEVELPEGSLLALYTDGLIETAGHDLDAGIDALSRTLARARATGSVEEICDALLSELLPPTPRDDVALLVVRPRALDASQVATWDVPADPAAVPQARKNAAAQLTAWGLDDAAFTTELVVSELVTNAIRYGHAPIRLRLIHERTLICEVSDGSSTAPHMRRALALDEGGRGLLLVAQFSRNWGARQTATGKTIWAELTLTGAPDPTSLTLAFDADL